MSVRARDDDAKEIFLELLDRPANQRRTLLDERCPDEDLRRRVDALLAAYERAGEFMAGVTADGRTPHTGPISGAPRPVPELGAAPAPGERPGDRIGPYTLLKVLGEGGFGTVHLAEQSEPVRRRVALKILKLGMDTQQVVARFEAERQALAMMDHPSIAKVYDAGATERGRPFFVMELVPGEPIDRFCDRRRLDVRERLALFEQVSLAVQHAHQKGIIHRDLKPSNVLVTVVDGRPLPKVIDFGIAKATETGGDRRSAATNQTSLIGTPEYMSPEQANLTPGDVDTRTDVYSLGVILYELLTGTPPFDRRRIHEGGFTAWQRMIREETPPKPSSRVLSVEAAGASGGGQRPTASTRTRRRLSGELDWIVMKCLEKDRRMRYQTAFALASDLRRFLSGEPVEAGPPSQTYRLRKLAARHRPVLIAGSIAAAALIALAVGGAVFGLRAVRAEKRARVHALEAARQGENYKGVIELANVVLQGLDPAVAQGADTTLLEHLLGEVVARVDAELAESPGVAAVLLNTIGNSYRLVGRYEVARDLFRRAVDEGRRAYGPDGFETLNAMNSLGAVLLETGDPAGAEKTLERCVERSRIVLGPDAHATMLAESNLARVLLARGRTHDAVRVMTKLLDKRRRLSGPHHDSTLTVMNNLASALRDLNDDAAAAPLLEEVLAVQLGTLGESDPTTLKTMNNLALTYLDIGRRDEGREMMERTLDVKRRIFPPGHPSIIVGLNNAADVLEDAGDVEAAEAYYTEALDLALESLGPEHRFTLILMNNLGNFCRRGGRLEEAVGHLERASETAAKAFGADHPEAVMMAYNYAGGLTDAGRFEAALGVAGPTVERAREAFGDRDARTANAQYELGRALAGLSQFEGAEAAFAGAAGVLDRTDNAPAKLSRRVADAQADLYEAWGRPDEAAAYRARADGLRASAPE